MKAAVSHLEPHMEKAARVEPRQGGPRHGQGRRPRHRQEPGRHHPLEQRLRGRQPRHQGAERAAHRPCASTGRTSSALSGLLVKSAQQMVVTAGDLRAGVEVPLVVGGAALSRRFTHRKIAPAYERLCTYAKDAMHGLELVERLTDPAKRGEPRRSRDRSAATARTTPAPASRCAPTAPRDPARGRRRWRATCRCRRRPTSTATSSRCRSDEVWPFVNRRCSTASTSASAAR
jgi:cobalamin-dependent methionine synthase I